MSVVDTAIAEAPALTRRHQLLPLTGLLKSSRKRLRALETALRDSAKWSEALPEPILPPALYRGFDYGISGRAFDYWLRAFLADCGIEIGGMTNLSAGWLSTSEIVATAADPGTYSRVIVLSDGHANAGITDRDQLADIAVGLRTRGIATTAVGVGAGYDDEVLSLVAAQSGGNLHHLDTLDGVGRILGSEFEELIGLYAQNLVLKIAPDANVIEATVLSGYPVQSRAQGLSIACGDIVSCDDRHVLIRLRCAPRTDGTHPLTGGSLKYHQIAGEVAFKELTALVAIDRATGLEATPMDTIVAQHLVIAKSVIARRDAADHADRGDIGSAATILSKSGDRSARGGARSRRDGARSRTRRFG
jgi:Ca-activated chloride channel family protein